MRVVVERVRTRVRVEVSVSVSVSVSVICKRRTLLVKFHSLQVSWDKLTVVGRVEVIVRGGNVRVVVTCAGTSVVVLYLVVGTRRVDTTKAVDTEVVVTL